VGFSHSASAPSLRPTASAADLLLAINKGDNTLAIVDAATLKVLGTAPTGPDPHEVVASADGKLAYITNYNAGNGFANSLSVVDLVAMKALPPIDLGALGRPHGIALADGKVYFTAEGAKVVGRYDPDTRRVDLVIGTGQDRTHMVIVSSDQKTLFTTNVSSATVSILEQFTVTRRGGPPPGTPPPGAAGRGAVGRAAAPPAATDWRVTVVPVGMGAEGFDLSPDGRELWVANAQGGSVSIVNVAKKAAETVSVRFRSANRLKFTPDGKYALISDLGGTEVIVMDAATRQEIKRIDVGGGAAGIQMSPDGSRAFAAVGSLNGVAIIDLKTLAMTGRIATGPGPDGWPGSLEVGDGAAPSRDVMAKTIKILCVHGLGDHRKSTWKADWETVLRSVFPGQTAVDAGQSTVQLEFSFLTYDDIFEGTDLSVWETMQAVWKLARSGVSTALRRERSVVGDVSDAIRWTAGYVVAWLEDDRFKRETTARVLDAVRDRTARSDSRPQPRLARDIQRLCWRRRTEGSRRERAAAQPLCHVRLAAGKRLRDGEPHRRTPESSSRQALASPVQQRRRRLHRADQVAERPELLPD
jgi:DNA-binding beta-propeller fold protein YncE